MTASPQEIQAVYEQNKATFSTPEQARASHILFKTEGKDKETINKAAEAVLADAPARGPDVPRGIEIGCQRVFVLEPPEAVRRSRLGG